MSKSRNNNHERDWVVFDNRSGSYRRLACRHQEEKEHESDLREALTEMDTANSTSRSQK